MKIFVIVKETYKDSGSHTYCEHENVKAFSNKQDAEFEWKYTYKLKNSVGDVYYSIEEMELL